MKKVLAGTLALTLLSGVARGDVNFTLTYESGSVWDTLPVRNEAKAIIAASLADLGALFVRDATITVSITDDANGLSDRVAQAGSSTGELRVLAGKPGNYYAGTTWVKINEGGDPNGTEVDAVIDFNLTDILADGDYQTWLADLRFVTIHEALHILGMDSAFSHGEQGTQVSATIHDAFLLDANGNSLLGAYNGVTTEFTLLDYAHGPLTGWNTSGIRFAGKWADGNVRLMDVWSSSNTIEFYHVSPASDGDASADAMAPNEAQVCYLRGLGYEIKAGVMPPFRPDLKIGASANQLTGNNRYSETSGAQAIAVARRGAGSGFVFQVENDHVETQTITVSATAGDRKVSVSYFRGSANVTGEVTGAGHASTYTYGQSESFQVVTKLSKAKAKGKAAKKSKWKVKQAKMDLYVHARASSDGSVDTGVCRMSMRR